LPYPNKPPLLDIIHDKALPWRSAVREVPVSSILTTVVFCAGLAPCAQAVEATAACHTLNLSPTALGDCEHQLGKAVTDADRAKVIHTFAAGLATAKADALVGQLSSSPPTRSAPVSKTSTAEPQKAAPATASTPAQDLAAPQQKATAASGGLRTGTKAGPQHTQAGTSADRPAAPPKAKAQKTAQQSGAKSANKTKE
jgi:hypothetical protein